MDILFRSIGILLLFNVKLSYLVFVTGLSGKLQVHIPKSLHVPGGYDHQEALFGVIPYGGSIKQNVYYSKTDMCDFSDSVGPEGELLGLHPQPPYILMIPRGPCSFTTKVRNAQQSGAAAVIIADNKCMCNYTNICKPNDPNEVCETRRPIMTNDGSSTTDITIPSMLMFKQDADPIIELLLLEQQQEQNNDNQSVVLMEMSWSSLPTKIRVDYELWTETTDLATRKFIHEFKNAALALRGHAYFHPRMYITDGITNGCRVEDDNESTSSSHHSSYHESYCIEQCTNGKRYCFTTGSKYGWKITSSEIAQESLRRLCIWQEYGKDDGVGVEWWDYIRTFTSMCDNKDYFTDRGLFADVECIKSAYKTSGVDGDRIDRCMRDSGGLTEDNINTYLEPELVEKKELGIVVTPTAVINKVEIRGVPLTFKNVFDAVCAGFAQHDVPDVCARCVSCKDPKTCVVTKGGSCTGDGATVWSISTNTATSNDAISIRFFMTSILSVVALFGGIGVWYYKRARNEMRKQVHDIVAEYLPLPGGDDDDAVIAGSRPLTLFT